MAQTMKPMNVIFVATLFWINTTVRATNVSSSECCRAGEELARVSGECKHPTGFFKRTFAQEPPKGCLGYLKHCCRKHKAEKDCQQGISYARLGSSCEFLTSSKAEDCCAACKDGLASTSCVAPWLEDDPNLSAVFNICCRHELRKDNVSPTTTAPMHNSWLTTTPRGHLKNRPTTSRKAGTKPQTCHDGYQYNRTLQKCVDIDECYLEKHSCPPGRLCVNIPGSFECSSNAFELQKVEVIPDCPSGYFFSRHLQECVDRDECSSDEHLCSSNEVCMNTLGSYICRSKSRTDCEPGYEFKEGSGCVDVDQCEGIHDCSTEEKCVDRAGQYMCVNPCHKHYKVDPVTLECVDIDECSLGTHRCSSLENCVNVEGGFRCEAKKLPDCHPGYARTKEGRCEDIDECSSNSHNCSVMENCVNSMGSHRCEPKPACDKGHRRNMKGQCEDIDECKEHRLPCGSHARCVNMKGTFVCVRTCGPGYRHHNGTCTDIDECLTGERVCLPGQRCENLEGSARCVDEDCELLGKVTAPDGTCLLARTCLKGFYHDTQWNDCKDVNECVSQYPACPPDEECVNTVGSFYCVRTKLVLCPEGLQRSADGQSCEDVDECLEGLHTCDVLTEDCFNLLGSFRCRCKLGFFRDRHGMCIDHVVNGVNSTCYPGFRYNGRTCEDIDECALAREKNSSLCEHICVNIPSSYRCHCHKGFEPHPKDPTKCTDIDECKRGSCAGICTNEIGSFKCSCPSGFALGDHSKCIDIDECRAGTHNCSIAEGQQCINIEGGFRCVDFSCPKKPVYRKDPKKMRCVLKETCEDYSCRLTPEIITHSFVSLRREGMHYKRFKIHVKPTRDANSFGNFSFRIDKVINRRQNSKKRLATDEDFKLETGSRYSRWAKLAMRRSLTEPQDIHLTLKAKIYRLEGWPLKDVLQKTLEWKIVVYVPDYKSGNGGQNMI